MNDWWCCSRCQHFKTQGSPRLNFKSWAADRTYTWPGHVPNFQYLYLLFDVDNPVNVHDSSYLFTTEGHILPISNRSAVGSSLSYSTCPCTAVRSANQLVHIQLSDPLIPPPHVHKAARSSFNYCTCPQRAVRSSIIKGVTYAGQPWNCFPPSGFH